MMNNDEVWMLSERAKELECIYAVDEVLQNKQLTIPAAMQELVTGIPSGFASPSACRIRIALNGGVYHAPDFAQVKILNTTPLEVGDDVIGSIEMGYIQTLLGGIECNIIENETKMLATIAGRISLLALGSQRELSNVFDMLKRIDPDMLLRICEKLRMHLRSLMGDRVNAFFDEIGIESDPTYGEVNTPLKKQDTGDTVELGKKLIAGATMYLSSNQISELVNGWVMDERAFSLVKMVDSKEASIEQILDTVREYTQAVGKNSKNTPTEAWLIAELCHRFLTCDEHFINLMRDNLQISDFEPMLEKIIGSARSQGSIGGKGVGLFVAKQILDHESKEDPLLSDIRMPLTWYLAADQIVDFLHHNHMEEMLSYKYNSIFHLRMTYDNVVSKIKNAKLPPNTIRMLRILLNDLKGKPLIVRSSSLLEDRVNAAFSGKYKSLFIPNQGTKEQCLEQLIDAILEVYSSMYSPDSIQYRSERGLLNFSEQMGILIQEVVGTRIGPYYMPLFAGVAFSDNLLRWSTRIKREDGLVRMVMGLGTRAVDRVNDDYPVLFCPGQPGLRINHTIDDIRYYSPRQIDLINLEKHQFETVSVQDFLKEYGHEVPQLHHLVSVCSDDFVQKKLAFALNAQEDDLVVTFEGILSDTTISAKLQRMLKVLSEKMKTPVDIEFAYDGQHMYLLQCRAQGHGGFHSEPAPIPKQLPPQDVLFTANRFITNGRLKDISHIVYVDPDGYNNLSTREDMLAVGKAVGLLGDLLPRRKYILMGPGRWGSRGDIMLGVRVTYSDICNTAALIEVAKEKHSYVPELSFGTHFFQDLVEADIVYIPLYPDQPGNVYKELFFSESDNLLAEILPQYAYLSDVLRVIDVPGTCVRKTLSIHLNADLEQAVAFLTGETDVRPPSVVRYRDDTWRASDNEEHWRWRQYMAEQIAAEMDMTRFGVKGVYLFGSTNTGGTHMRSDIDLLLHFDGNGQQRTLLCEWLRGWSKALAKINFLHTGYAADEMLDIHIVTDEDIQNNDSFAAKIGSITDPAALLRERPDVIK